MFFDKRSTELELIDLGPSYYSKEEYDDCLNKLDQVGEYLGGDNATFKALEALPFSPQSILDVGCGGGGFTQKLGDRFKNGEVKGIEISSQAIEHAKKHNHCKNVTYELVDLKDVPPKSFDVVISTLVCHHLSDDELISFIHECLRIAKRKVIINDLHRHPLAWLGYSLAAPILFRNRLITSDGLLSIKRAFKAQDWKHYLSKLKIDGNLSWHWPFRWILTIEAE